MGVPVVVVVPAARRRLQAVEQQHEQEAADQHQACQALGQAALLGVARVVVAVCRVVVVVVMGSGVGLHAKQRNAAAV